LRGGVAENLVEMAGHDEAPAEERGDDVVAHRRTKHPELDDAGRLWDLLEWTEAHRAEPSTRVANPRNGGGLRCIYRQKLQ
jgi:hypothetical protein